MATVKLSHIKKVYANGVEAVHDFSLLINDKEFIVLVGPSGCGKSTTLRMVAGLEDISAGELSIDGVITNDLDPKDRDIAMVFQNYALYPHMSVYDNIAFGLRNRHVEKAKIDERVKDVAVILGIDEYLDRKPKELSGGQCQRVALGRALVRHAKVFLMDEPLSNLDAKLRVSMRSQIIKLHEAFGATTIYVTHDQTEAMSMATRIVVMKKGYIQQIGTPREIYSHPANRFVAGFIGSPSMNFLDAYFDKGDVVLPGYRLPCSEEQKKAIASFYSSYKVATEQRIKRLSQESSSDASQPAEKMRKPILPLQGANLEKEKKQREADLVATKKELSRIDEVLSGKSPLSLGVRPEDIVLTRGAGEGLQAEADVLELLGHNQIVHSMIGKVDVETDASSKLLLTAHEKIALAIPLDSYHLFDYSTEKTIF